MLHQIIPLLGGDMSQLPMGSQYWPNISRQDIANANITNENPILSQCDLTRELQRQYRQWETKAQYLCCLDYMQVFHCS